MGRVSRLQKVSSGTSLGMAGKIEDPGPVHRTNFNVGSLRGSFCGEI